MTCTISFARIAGTLRASNSSPRSSKSLGAPIIKSAFFNASKATAVAPLLVPQPMPIR